MTPEFRLLAEAKAVGAGEVVTVVGLFILVTLPAQDDDLLVLLAGDTSQDLDVVLEVALVVENLQL